MTFDDIPNEIIEEFIRLDEDEQLEQNIAYSSQFGTERFVLTQKELDVIQASGAIVVDIGREYTGFIYLEKKTE